MNKYYILAIESSCDDTAVAIIDEQKNILADVNWAQNTAHAPYGGIVPEIASREHLQKIPQAVAQALQDAQLSAHDLKAIAVTCGPGLIGSLLVGVQFARGLAQSLNIPLIGIHHIEGHLLSSSASPNFPQEPFIALIASGGHSALYLANGQCSYELLGETQDDAAGEAFDKIAKMLGYGYPGGRIIDELAEKGDEKRFNFPIAFRGKDNLDYSFSGLKTSVRLQIEKLQQEHSEVNGQLLYDLCASVRKAIVDALLAKAFLACKQRSIKFLVLGGGVAANSQLRAQAQKQALENKISVFLPEKAHCTDNAVMIALAAKNRSDLELVEDLKVDANAPFG